ncbi:MAG TPA: hypothetical protein VGQ57_01400 [Polyangiaceae bacterium]|nr:hypothetical protein [Polyangiaceae bacterium]
MTHRESATAARAATATTEPRRTVIQAEALAWLAEHPAAAQTSVITSLPDVSELGEDFEGWRRWFLAAAEAVLRWAPDDGVTIFFQTDVLHRGIWIDKSFLVSRAAEASGHALVWHKIVCRAAPGAANPGRPGYSHLLCFAREPRPAFRHPLPDVLADAGFEASQKAMGAEACALAVRFVLAETNARTIVDPFCGQGTALAVANAWGLDALGIDRSARCCRAARKLTMVAPQRA